jgi:hypothetical protein
MARIQAPEGSIPSASIQMKVQMYSIKHRHIFCDTINWNFVMNCKVKFKEGRKGLPGRSVSLGMGVS